MIETFLVKDKNTNLELKIDINTPDFCPYCKRYIYPNFETITNINDIKILNDFYSVVAVVYSCPACKNFFFKTYALTDKFEGGAYQTQDFLIDLEK